MGMLPNVISGLIEARVSIVRVQKFLLNTEIGTSYNLPLLPYLPSLPLTTTTKIPWQ